MWKCHWGVDYTLGFRWALNVIIPFRYNANPLNGDINESNSGA